MPACDLNQLRKFLIATPCLPLHQLFRPSHKQAWFHSFSQSALVMAATYFPHTFFLFSTHNTDPCTFALAFSLLRGFHRCKVGVCLLSSHGYVSILSMRYTSCSAHYHCTN